MCKQIMNELIKKGKLVLPTSSAELFRLVFLCYNGAHFITVLVLHSRNFSITSADQLHQKIKSRWNSALLDNKVVQELLY